MGETDLISRQAAIDALIERDPNCGIDSAEVIKALPSASPKKVCVAEVKVEIDDIKDYIDKAINAERWIPCSERLPEYGEDVLITDEWGVYIARCYNLSRNREEPQASWWYGDANEYRTHPLAWMPLPEPYKGEQE